VATPVWQHRRVIAVLLARGLIGRDPLPATDAAPAPTAPAQQASPAGDPPPAPASAG
jgi:hypothetical protein